MKRKIKRRKNKQRKILIIGSLSMLLFLCVGYAAFSTNLSLTAKGNIKELRGAEYLRKVCNQTSGDGLYKDIYEEGRCVYKGANPNNYINFNNELWRIISVEKDNNLKIIKEESFGPMSYDGSSTDNRYNENNTYCTLSSGGANYSCNVWGGVSGNFVNKNFSGTVNEDADLNIYLNNTYYNSLTEEAKNEIQIHDFQMDGKADKGTVQNYITNTNKYFWYGNIGLIDIADWFKASNNPNCTLSNSDWCPMSNYNREDYECSYDNYLYKNNQFWTINPNNNSVRYLLVVGSYGCIGNASSTVSYDVYVRPVVFLKENIKLQGKGTLEDPYKIKKV